MATLSNSALNKEVEEILGKSKHFILPDCDFIIHTKDKDIVIPYFLTIEVERNYTENISDVLYVEFLIGAGTAIKTIFENRDALEATIKLKFSNKKIVKRRYKLILITKPEEVHDSKIAKAKEDTLNSQDLAKIKAQCVDELVLQLKNEYISGVFHNYDLKTLLKGIMGKRLKELSVDAHINIYEPDNKKIYENILIRPFTKFIKLPYILQNGDYGIYNYGANVYFSNITETNKIKYDVDIYPVYDYTRYKKETKRPKLLLINPENFLRSKNEFNFYYKDGVYKGIVNNLEFKLDSEDKRYTIGNGIIVEYSNNTINQDLSTVTDDKIIFSNDLTYDITKIDDTRSFSHFVETDGDDNIFKYYSLLNRLQVIIASVVLPKVNPEVIYPGMPVVYYFINSGKIYSTTGTVQGIKYFYDFINKTSVVTLILALKRIKKDK